MTQFKKCQTTYCDRTATKKVKLFVAEYEDKLGGWKEDSEKQSNLFDCGRGFAVAKIRKHHKANVCKKCYDYATPQDFVYFDYDGKEKAVARVERL